MRKKDWKRTIIFGMICITAFVIWTCLIQIVDVQPIGQNGTDVGFAALNSGFHKITGVHMVLYTVTDWMGLIPVCICILFAGIGFAQLVQRRSLLKVDFDMILLGIYYAAVISGYFIFEMIPINYRPILMNGIMEASYPSSTTLLVLGVMPTLVFQADRRLNRAIWKKMIRILTIIFSAFMVIGRVISGVHWITDIVGSVMLSAGLFFLYKGIVLRYCKEENEKKGSFYGIS